MARQSLTPVALLAAVGAVVLAGCRPQLSPPTAAVLCEQSAQCPSGSSCLAGLCRAAGDACTSGALDALELQADGTGCTRAGGQDGLCLQGACVEPRCGDGFVSDGESCDRGELNSPAPDAPCRPDCTPPRCGDGVVDSTEECEPGLSEPLPCQLFGPGFHAGQATCSAACLYASDTCERCGDGIVNGDETCDGAAPAGLSCLTLGFDAGRLGCNPLSCQADLDSCVRFGWTQLETSVRSDLNDLDGPLDGSLLYTVGDGGAILRYQDGDWRKVPSPTPADLESVVVVSSSPELAWAAGADGTLLKLTEAGAELLPGPAAQVAPDFESLVACGPERLAVATKQELFEFDGSWSQIDLPDVGFTPDVMTLACVDGETWLLLDGYYGGNGTLHIRRGGAWLPEGGFVVCRTPSSIDVAGRSVAISCTQERRSFPVVVTYSYDPEGPQLEPVPSQEVPHESSPPSIRWAANGDLWLFGSNGLLGNLSPAGDWFGEELDLPFYLNAGWSGPDRLSFAAGVGGTLLTSHGYGRRTFETPAGGNLLYRNSRGLCMREGGELVAIDGSRLLRLGPQQSWEVLAQAPGGQGLEALHCDPGSPVVCAVGANGYVGCLDPASGALVTLRSAATGGPDTSLADVWRAPDGTLFVSAPSSVPSTVWRRDADGTWTHLPVATPDGMVGEAYYLGGTSSTDVYTLGRCSGLQHYSGGAGFELTPLAGEAWTSLNTCKADLWVGPDAAGKTVAVVATALGSVLVLRDGAATSQQYGRLLNNTQPVGLWGERYEDLFLAQDTGDAYHFDGELWSPVRFEPLYRLWAISGRSGDSLYVAGETVHRDGTMVQVHYPRPIGAD